MNWKIMRKAIFTFLFALLGYTECFAMAPDYIGIGRLVLVVLGGILLLFVGIGIVVSKNRAIGALSGAGLFFLILVGINLYANHSSKKYNKGIEEMVASERKAADLAESYMMKLCETDEKFLVNRKIPFGSSILINLFPEHKPPTADNPRPVVPTTAMKEEQRKYGRSFPPMGNGQQYLRLIKWVENADRPETIAKLVKTDLIESRDRYKTKGKPFKRMATKQKWEKDHLSDIAIAYTERYIDEYKFKNWPDSKLLWHIPIPIDNSSAQYVFTIDDISTLNDRKNWIARGRIRLQDTGSGEVVAEYTGFQNLLRQSAVCPDAAKIARTSNGQPDMLTFFFNKVMQHTEDN